MYTDTLRVEDICGHVWRATLEAKVVDTSASIKSQDVYGNTLNLTLIPNPVQGTEELVATFRLPTRTSVTVQVFNPEGTLVWEREREKREAGEQREDIDVRTLPSGRYYLVLSTEEGKGIRTFMVVR